MINSKSFIGEKDGYLITIEVSGFSPYWDITKNGIVIDKCFYHKPTKCELSAKVQSERVLNKILTPSPAVKSE